MVKRKFIKTNTNSSQSIFRYIIGIGVPLVVIIGLIILILYITKKGIFKKESSSTTKPTKPTVFPPPNPPPPVPSSGDFAKFINPILELNGIKDPQSELLFNSKQYDWNSFIQSVDMWNQWANDTSDPYRPTYCTFLTTSSCMDSVSGTPGCHSPSISFTPNQVLQEMCAIFANAMVETDGFKACKEYLGCSSELSNIKGIKWIVGGSKKTTVNYPDPIDGNCKQQIGDSVDCSKWTANYGSGESPDPNTKTSKSCGGNICLYLNPPPDNPQAGTWTSCGGVHGEMSGNQYDFSSNAGCKNNGGATQIACPEPPVECSDFMGNTAIRDSSASEEDQIAGMSKVGCFYGRGLAQLTTPCNYGAMSYYTKDMPYMKQLGQSFCSHPDALCNDQIAGWLGNIWYWVALVKKGWIQNNRCFGTTTANYQPSGGAGSHQDTSVNVSPGTRAQWYAWFLLYKFPKGANGDGWNLKYKTPSGTIQITTQNFNNINWKANGDFLYVDDGNGEPQACGQSQPTGCVALGGGKQAGFCCPDCSQINNPEWVKNNCSLGWCSSSESNCGTCSKKWCPNTTKYKK